MSAEQSDTPNFDTSNPAEVADRRVKGSPSDHPAHRHRRATAYTAAAGAVQLPLPGPGQGPGSAGSASAQQGRRTKNSENAAAPGPEERPNDNGAQGPNKTNPGSDVEAQGLDAIPEGADLADTHSCGKCKLIFTSLQSYIKHKLSKDNCRVTYTKNRRVLIPNIEIKQEKPDKENAAATRGAGQDPHKAKRGRPPGSRMKLNHREEDIIDSSHRYKCDTCERSFIREAALRRHMDYDHHQDSDSGDEDDEGEEADDGEAGDSYRPSGPLLKKLKIEPQEVAPSSISSPAFIPAASSEALDEEGDVPILGHISLGGTAELWPSAERAYVCQECGKTFKEAGVLKVHRLTHTDARDYVCSQRGCTFAFKTKGSLKRHMRRHTGERPFKCDRCGRSFGESGALTRHLRARTSCTKKTDADLPRYGKKVSLNQDIPAAYAGRVRLGQSGEPVQGQPVQGQPVQGQPVQKEQDGTGSNQQQPVVFQEILPSETFIKVIRIENVEAFNAMSEEGPFQVVVETNGIDGAPGEEEVIEEVVGGVAGNHGNQEDADADAGAGDGGEEAVMEDVKVIEVDLEEEVATAAAMASDVVATSVVVSDKVHMCLVCQAMCDGSESLVNHLKTHLNRTPYKCRFCTYSAPKKDDLKLHLQITHKDKLQPEDEESDPPTLLDQIAQQVREHQVEQEHATEDSGEQNRQASVALQQLLEIQEATPGEDVSNSPVTKPTKHTCPVCGRIFRGPSYLALHMRTHTGERPHKCSCCEKTFMSKDTLTKHMTTHSDERNFKCGECGKLFKRISHAREHLKVHSMERPFPCTLCDKTFKSANACKVHLRTHTDILPYRCRYCHKQFRERSGLERHVRSHTGDRPFRCQHCGRCFGEHGTLARHLKAKVPCTKQLQFLRSLDGQPTPITIVPMGHQVQPTQLLATDSDSATTSQGEPLQLQVISEITAESESAAQSQDQQHVEEEITNVLAEFSSVVADTQQYIVEPSGVENVNEASGECVLLTEDDSGQKIEIITQDPASMVTEIQDTEYILLSQDEDNITVLNRSTGETLVMRSTDTVIQREDDAGVAMETMEVIAMEPEVIDGNAMMGSPIIEETVDEHDVHEESVEIVNVQDSERALEAGVQF